MHTQTLPKEEKMCLQPTFTALVTRFLGCLFFAQIVQWKREGFKRCEPLLVNIIHIKNFLFCRQGQGLAVKLWPLPAHWLHQRWDQTSTCTSASWLPWPKPVRLLQQHDIYIPPPRLCCSRTHASPPCVWSESPAQSPWKHAFWRLLLMQEEFQFTVSFLLLLSV